MTHATELLTDEPALSGLRRFAGTLAAAAVLTLSAGLAQARELFPAPEPRIVEVALDTDSLFWDLCVGPHQTKSRERLVDAITRELDDPEALYVIRLPQIPARWDPPGQGALYDMHGNMVDRRRLAFTRGAYERRVEETLLSVFDTVQKDRPGARVTFEGFRALPERLRRIESYDRLEDALPFVSLPGDAPTSSARRLGRWLDKLEIDEDKPALIRSGDGWFLVSDENPSTLLEPSSDGALALWPDPGAEADIQTAQADESPDFEQPDAAPEVEPAETDVTKLGRERLASLGGGGVPQISVNRPDPSPRSGDGNPPRPDAPGDDGADPPQQPGGDGSEPDDQTPIDGAAPTLIAGPGFDGPTAQPAAVGEPQLPGYDAKAIARWDVVPFQTIDEPFEIGVVAFHMNGIDRVDFSVNGGPWGSVYEMTLNPRTGVHEYWAYVDPSQMEDGQFEVRARIFPQHAGQPRLLAGPLNEQSLKTGEHSLLMSADHGGTLPKGVRYVAVDGDDANGDGSRESPYASMMKAVHSIGEANGGLADGGMVYLLPGDHVYGSYEYAMLTRTQDRWVTVAPAPDLLPGEARITSVGNKGLRTKLVRLKGLIVRGSEIQDKDPESAIWVDGCDLGGAHANDDVRLIRESTYPLGVYLTDSRLHSVWDASKEIGFIRNSVIENIGTDALRNPLLVLNTTVRDLGNAENYGHRDLIQFYRGAENVIISGLNASDAIQAQGLFVAGIEDDTINNVAIINSLLAPQTHFMQWGMSGDHILIRQNTLWRRLVFRDDSRRPAGHDTTRLTNLVLEDNLFYRLEFWIEDLGARIDNNFFVEGDPIGDNALAGDPGLRDPSRADFQPASGSPLLFRVENPALPHDVTGDPRPDPASIGAEEPIAQ